MEASRKTIGWQGAVLADTYRVLQRLGKGGMGEVYEAEHLRVGKKVAVKFMKGDVADDRRAAERFRREVRALSAITSEYVVSVLDCGELDGETPWVVMERLYGEDLRHLLAREGPLSIYRAIRLALDACAGLAAVHEAGLVHRDLKPANLFVTGTKSRGELCKILDFGVAKKQASDATGQGALIGTVRYMAPEQLSDGASVAPTTDVYAIGAILFECLTGRPVHEADTPEELMFNILNREPPLVTELRSEVPDALAETIRIAMSRKQRDRFQSVVELAEVLAEFLPARDSAETARDESQVERLPARLRRPWTASRAKFAVGAAFAGGIVLGLLLSRLFASDASATSPTNSNAQAAVAEPKTAPPNVPLPASSPKVEQPAATTTPSAAPSNDVPTVASERRSTPVPAKTAAAERATRSPATAVPKRDNPAAQPGVVLDEVNPYEK